MSLTSLRPPPPGDMALACAPPVINQGYFAFASVKGQVRLVQVSTDTPTSALTTVDVKIFRHEFITIFRLLEARTLHPADISIIETIHDYHTRYEEENETVFLAKELMGRMQRMMRMAERPLPLPQPGVMMMGMGQARTSSPGAGGRYAGVRYGGRRS